MPEIAVIDGIRVCMFYAPREHEPAHFHAYHGSDEAIFDLQSLEVTGGSLRATQRSAVQTWAKEHAAELADRWSCAMAGQPIVRIG
jgi:hypothetical protein